MENGPFFLSDLNFSPPAFYEYLLVVNPAGEAFELVREEKKNFCADYNVSIAGKTLPHIKVVNFLARETMEETIIKWMHKIISSQQCFTVMLNNFSGFPGSNTVYARVQNHAPFKQLAASLQVIDEYVRSNGFPAAKVPNHPHITIAKCLQSSVYNKAIMDYSRKTFSANFLADKVILLKRQNQYDACRQVNVFKLAPASNLN